MERSNLIYVGVALVGGVVLGLALATFLPATEHVAESRPLPLWVEIFHRICTGVGGAGTFIALLYVIRQFALLRTQSELMQKNVLASLDGQLYNRLDSLNRLIVEHHAEYDLLSEIQFGDEQHDCRAGLHHICDTAFSFYEQIFKLFTRYALMDSGDWAEWQQRMVYFFGKGYVPGYWRKVRLRYDRRFREFADQLADKENKDS